MNEIPTGTLIQWWYEHPEVKVTQPWPDYFFKAWQAFGLIR